MKFGMGSIAKLTQKYQGQSTKMAYVRPNIYNINKYPRFSIVLPLIMSRSPIIKCYRYLYHGTFKLSNQIAQFEVNIFHTHLLGDE